MIERNHIDISTLVQEQLPGFVLDTGVSMLPRFLEYYYEFMESEDEQNNFTRDILKYFDSFRTKEDVLNWNYEEVSLMPHRMSADKRKFAKRVYDFYRTKGTEESIKLLFRAFYDVDVDITYPSKNILRASDGRWTRESEILVKLSYGTIDTFSEVKVVLSLTNGLVVYKTALRAVKVDSLDEYWLTFDAGQKITADPGNRVIGYDDSGSVLFVGEVSHTPTKVEIISTGKGFRVGQIFRVPGTYRDSVFKITSVGNVGDIRSCEMIQFGYGHPENFTIDITPFKSFPSSSSYTYSITQVSPTEAHHSIGINDAIYQISDRVDGGSFVTDSSINEQTSSLPTASIGITIDSYQESISTIKIVSGGVSRYPGKWTTNDGRLNTPDIVLQDNYYYQAFSYVINGDVNLEDYQNTILKISHPAGMRNFANMVKTTTMDISSSIEVSHIRKHFMNFDDGVLLIDGGMRRTINKFFDEGSILGRYVVSGYWDDAYSLDTTPLVINDQVSKIASKFFIESSSVTDSSANHVTKTLNEAILASDVTVNSMSKGLSDSVDLVDIVSNGVTKTLNEVILASDSATNSITKTLNEVILASDLSVNTTTKKVLSDSVGMTDYVIGQTLPYTIVGYWEPGYVSNQINLT